MRKSSRLYLLILGIWAALIAITFLPLLVEVQRSDDYGLGVFGLVLLSTLFICYFWLNGTKDVVYTLYYYIFKKSLIKTPPKGFWKTQNGDEEPYVLLVYCACDDFSAESLTASMQQNYGKYDVVILDDSKKEDSKEEIMKFARENHIYVMRRKTHEGFKAGNLNNFLKRANYDYFVILDSDEIIPSDFITRSLDYFAYFKGTGIVQANHIATRNRNQFMDLFAIGVNSHWLTYQATKHHHGFLSLLGHGAMVSRECYEAAGGFPHLVAEDLCFSIEARNKGYYVAFAPDIICEEEYPINYLAFKKRHNKWTQGNMEFIKKYTGKVLGSKMRWYEKLDIVLFTYNLPLTAFFSFYIVINVIVLPLMGYNITYPVWMLIPTAIFLIAPLLNDMIFYAGKMKIRTLIWYIGHSVLLYGSMFFISLKASLTSIFNKSVFLVTPKNHHHISVGEAFMANKAEIVFAISMLVIATICSRSPLPTLLISIPALSSVYLTLISNRTGKQLVPEKVRVNNRL
jgi:cellulose synthase/poly-beta-1,6-N-acetylglucosamine synthase-like glycosyltransferase